MYEYKITREDFDMLLLLQLNHCGICGSPFKNWRDCHIDHNHLTGHIRGLLCARCNLGLGILRDNPTILRNGIQYLKGMLTPLRDMQTELNRKD
jgi:hypothetical protein